MTSECGPENGHRTEEYTAPRQYYPTDPQDERNAMSRAASGKAGDATPAAHSSLPEALETGKRARLSFKNRILFSTLLVLVGGVITIGIILQVAVFPSLKGDSTVINNLKTIHLLASVLVIIVSWLFIEGISITITRPLQELTQRADQVSREAGASVATAGPDSESEGQGELFLYERGLAANYERELASGDELVQLTTSFNRMLFYLKASEARLRQSEEKYRFLFDNNPSPIFVMDADNMMILDVNARAEEEYQYTRAELLGMSFSDLGLAQHREQTSSRLKQIYPTEVTVLPVLQHKRKDGTLFMGSFQIRLTTFRDRPALIASVWDVTERLQKHAMVVQASKMATLGEMATGIAHELNQPLNVIRLGCDYLTKRTRTHLMPAADDLREVTKELASNVERASRIINHLREFGRKAERTMSSVDINEPIRNVFTMIGTQFDTRSIAWKLELADSLPTIHGDKNRLEQVLINLVINARDAIITRRSEPENDKDSWEALVVVRSFVEGSRVVVTVTDTGTGIEESIRDRVFEPFFTTKKTGDGTGLGLSISYAIIKEHEGTIEIVRRQGPGTTFRLTFPALTDGDCA